MMTYGMECVNKADLNFEPCTQNNYSCFYMIVQYGRVGVKHKTTYTNRENGGKEKREHYHTYVG